MLLTAQQADKPYFESMTEKDVIPTEDAVLNLENKVIPKEIYDEAYTCFGALPRIVEHCNNFSV